MHLLHFLGLGPLVYCDSICFLGCNPDVVTQLIQAYSTAFHGAAIWSLKCGELKNLEVSLNKMIRLIWRLPYNSHVNLTHKIAGFSSIYNMVYSRSRIELFEAALQSRNPTAISVFSEAAASVILMLDLTVCLGLSILGFTLRKRWHWCILYVKFDYVCGGLIDGFPMEELDYIVSTV